MLDVTWKRDDMDEGVTGEFPNRKKEDGKREV